MFGAAWWLGLDRNLDPAQAASRLREKISNARQFTALMVCVGVGSYWAQSMQRPSSSAVPWGQMSFLLCWGVIVAMALLMPTIAGHESWSRPRRRFVIRMIWLSAVLLVIAAAWDIGLYSDRRWGYYSAWQGLYFGFLIGFVLLVVLGWFTLAGTQLDRFARCGCPPPMKRWMRTAPLPRSVGSLHECPKAADPEAIPEAA